ncbi:MAG: hypothetical protein NT113_22910 [Hyphomicrobiales bacterium]|nr:hypothetical protein [Hyphomicrobiales bacterium]
MSGKDHFEKDPFDPDAYEAFKRAVASRGSRPSIPNDAGIEAPEEIAERGRAMFRRALMQADADDLQEDLRQMLEALGMSDHARPYSPHRVFQEALNEMKRQLAAVPRSAAIVAAPTTSPEPDAVRASGKALVRQLRSTMHRLDGQAYSSLLSQLNEFDAALSAPVAGTDHIAEVGKLVGGAPVAGAWQDISTAPKDREILAVRIEWWEPENGNHRWIHGNIRQTKWDAERQRFGFNHEKQPTHWTEVPAIPALPIPRNHGEGGGPRS